MEFLHVKILKSFQTEFVTFSTKPRSCLLITFFEKRENMSGEKKFYLSLKSYRVKKYEKEISSSTTFNSLSKLI